MPTAKKSAQTKKTNTKPQSKPQPNQAVSAAASGRAPRKPVRRGAGALVCLLLSVFAFIGYSTSGAVFIAFLRETVRGLTGAAFYLLPPLLLYCSFILAFHRGRPVALRVFASLMLTVSLGALIHLIGQSGKYEFSRGIFKELWAGGQAGIHGGLAGGLIAVALEKFVGLAGAIAVIAILTAFLLLASSGHSVADIYDAVKNRPRREYEPEPPRPKPETYAAEYPPHIEPPAKTKRRRRAIDIPYGKSAPKAEDPVAETDPYTIHEPEETPPVILASAQDAEPEEIHRGMSVDIPFLYDTEPKITPRASPPLPSRISDIETIEMRDAEIPVKTEEPEPEFVKPKSAPRPKPVARDPGDTADYRFPPLDLLGQSSPLQQGGADEVRSNTERLSAAFRSFGVKARIVLTTQGPSVTRYEALLEDGVKLANLTRLADDLALALGKSGVRIAAMPEKRSTVGIEVPNKHVSPVNLREIIESDEFQNAKDKLSIAIGKNIPGEAIVGNISKLTHLLVAGTTGSGKSVCLNSLILSILYKAAPDEVRLIMIDPKMVEFRVYNGIPHLLTPVVTDVKKASGALQWAVVEMEKRYNMFSQVGTRDLESYNNYLRRNDEKPVYQLVVIIDELADLMMTSRKEVEESIIRIAQKGRAAGVHLVIATQSPRKDVITGLMKANFPSKIALKVASALESRIILDAGGAADKLVGNGDMLYAPNGSTKPVRVQGTWVTEAEREAVVEFVKAQAAGADNYESSVADEIERAAYNSGSKNSRGGHGGSSDDGDGAEFAPDEKLAEAAEAIFKTKTASTSMLQRQLGLGHGRAGRIIDQLETVGLVGAFEGSKPRQILMTREQWNGSRWSKPQKQSFGGFGIDGEDEDGEAPWDDEDE
ncbi:MAG: DNA translocase FtsK [Oscillospiraceae bacterium]|jgi:S-DNA-T family DNA segregation ATPase FtsK/SpoIIIE|nr:DNA translocase FtsK [Oscillospiraceae bacterium]